jgi:hypothetical protein
LFIFSDTHINLLLLFNIDSNCQKKAIITDTGEEVELNDDGTWKYIYDDPSGSVKLDTVILSRPKDSDFLVKSNKLDIGIWLNKKKWSYSENKNEEESPAEFNFKLIGEDAYGMIIVERIGIPMDNLLEIALNNARNAASDIRVVKKECRQVNGSIVYYMQMEGTIQGIDFVYLGYYRSDKNGSIQFLTYTAQNLLKEYQKDMEELLNGFVNLE